VKVYTDITGSCCMVTVILFPLAVVTLNILLRCDWKHSTFQAFESVRFGTCHLHENIDGITIGSSPMTSC